MNSVSPSSVSGPVVNRVTAIEDFDFTVVPGCDPIDYHLYPHVDLAPHSFQLDLSRPLPFTNPRISQGHLAHAAAAGGENEGGDTVENIGAPGAPNQFEFKIFRPRPHNEEPIELRPENRVVVGIIIKQPKAGLSWSSIQLLDTGPAKSSKIRRGAKLYVILEVHGATTGTHFVAACRNCSRKVSSASSSSSLFDFVAKDGLIAIVGGTAELGFRFRCLPRHHGTADTEYRLTVVISDGGQILSRHTLTNWLRVVHHLNRKRNRPPAVPPGAIETPCIVYTGGDSEESLDALPNAHVSDGGSSGTSAGDSRHFVAAQPSYTSAQSSLADPRTLVPRANEDSEPGCGLPAPPAQNIKPIHGTLPVLSHMNPRRGPTKGDIEIYLIVRNLSPTDVLYARFGYNIAPTSHIAHGVLSCVLPATIHPGVVGVTLCQVPSVHVEGYGTSLVSFAYESDPSPETLITSWWNGDFGSRAVDPSTPSGP